MIGVTLPSHVQRAPQHECIRYGSLICVTAFEKAIDTNKKRRLELYKAVSSKLDELAH
jgi:hypothetical protein